MSSLFKSASCWIFEFSDLNRKRKRLRLGNCAQSTAQEVRRNLDKLIECKSFGAEVPGKVRHWLATVDARLKKQLSQLALGDVADVSLKDFLDDFIAKKTFSSDATRYKMQLVVDRLNQCFPKKSLRGLSYSDAVQFQDFLSRVCKLGENSVRRNCGFARQFLQAAFERQLIERNPFQLKEINTTVGVAEKDYVETGTIEELINSCEHIQWKLLFAMSRFLGLRIPSEINQMRWEHINWEKNQLTIFSPKTARKNKPFRVVPLPVKVRLHLESAHAVRDTASPYVFSCLRHHSNLATGARRLLTKVQMKTWKAFWNSLRASCQTDLMDAYGIGIACDIVGNSPAIAYKYYRLLRGYSFIERQTHAPQARPTELSRFNTFTGGSGSAAVEHFFEHASPSYLPPVLGLG